MESAVGLTAQQKQLSDVDGVARARAGGASSVWQMKQLAMVPPPLERIAVGSLTPMVVNAPSWRFSLTRAGDRSGIQSNWYALD